MPIAHCSCISASFHQSHWHSARRIFLTVSSHNHLSPSADQHPESETSLRYPPPNSRRGQFEIFSFHQVPSPSGQASMGPQASRCSQAHSSSPEPEPVSRLELSSPVSSPHTPRTVFNPSAPSEPGPTVPCTFAAPRELLIRRIGLRLFLRHHHCSYPISQVLIRNLGQHISSKATTFFSM